MLTRLVIGKESQGWKPGRSCFDYGWLVRKSDFSSLLSLRLSIFFRIEICLIVDLYAGNFVARGDNDIIVFTSWENFTIYSNPIYSSKMIVQKWSTRWESLCNVFVLGYDHSLEHILIVWFLSRSSLKNTSPY